MKLADVPLVIEVSLEYARYRLGRPKRAVHALTQACGGREELSSAEHVLARKGNRGLQRLGVRCLGRAVVMARILRRRGVAGSITLSVAADDPRRAHAELAIGGRPLRPLPEGHVQFR